MVFRRDGLGGPPAFGGDESRIFRARQQKFFPHPKSRVVLSNSGVFRRTRVVYCRSSWRRARFSMSLFFSSTFPCIYDQFVSHTQVPFLCDHNFSTTAEERSVSERVFLRHSPPLFRKAKLPIFFSWRKESFGHDIRLWTLVLLTHTFYEFNIYWLQFFAHFSQQ